MVSRQWTSGRWLAGLAFPVVAGVALAQSEPPDVGKLYAQRCAACHGIVSRGGTPVAFPKEYIKPGTSH